MGSFCICTNRNSINFLGRAFESRYFGARTVRANSKAGSKPVIKDRHDLDPPAPLSDSLVNVLSEGLFMMNERHGDRSHDTRTVARLFLLQGGQAGRAPDTAGAVQFDAFLLRAELPEDDATDNVRAFLEYNSARQWAGEGKIFNFRDVDAGLMPQRSAKHVHVLLFEDFVQDRPYFAPPWETIMDVARRDLIMANLGASHLNRDQGKTACCLVRKHDKRPWRHTRYRR